MNCLILLAQADEQTSFGRLLDRLDSGDLHGLLTIVIGCTLALCIVAIVQWRMVRVAQIESELKHEMLALGMPADDIARVLNAGSSGRTRTRHRCTSGATK